MNRQRNVFVALMKSMSQQQELYNKAMDSTNALQEANDVKAQSIEGRINTLKDTTKEMWSTLINSDEIKGIISGLTVVIEKFGKLSTIIGVVTTSILIFKGKALMSLITDLAKVCAGETALSVATIGLKSAFNGLTTAIASNPFGAIAVALMSIVTIVNSLPTSMDKIEKISKSVNKAKETLKNVEDNSNLVKQYEELQDKIDSGKLSTEELTNAKKELVSVQKQLAEQFPTLIAGYDSEGNAIISNTDKIKDKIKESKDLAIKELESDYTRGLNVLNSKYTQGFFDKLNLSGRPYGTDPSDEKLNKISSEDRDFNTSAIEEYKYYIELLKEGNSLNNKQKERYEGLKEIVEKYNDVIFKIYDTTKDINSLKGMKVFDNGELKDAVEYFTKIKKETNETKDNIRGNLINKWGKDINEKYSSTNYDDSKKEFVQSIEQIEKIQKIINEMGNSKKFDDNTLKQIIDLFPELSSHIDDTTYCINYLQNKINELSDTQKQAYIKMMENSEDYFKNTIANTENWKNFTDSCYQLLSNSDNDYYKQMAEDMKNNFENCKSLAEAKKNVELACIKIISEAWATYYKTIAEINSQQAETTGIGGDYVLTGSDAYRAGVNSGTSGRVDGNNNLLQSDSEKARNEASNNISEAYNNYADKLSNNLKELENNFKLSTPNSISKIGSNITDNKSTSTTAKDYTVENLEDQTDAYHDLNNAITDVQSNIKLLESRYENLYGTAKTNAIRERISLLQQEKDLHSQMVDKINSELAQQRANLSAKGVSFASNGEISNYNQILTSLTNQANAINTVDENTKKAKEDAIKAVKDIKKQMDEYTSTITKDLASQKESWKDLENQIQDTYKTMLQEVQTGESKVSDVIKNEIDKRKKKELDAIDEVKKALQKQWDTDDYEDQLKEAQDKVLEYEDKIKNAISKGDSNSLKDLRKEQQDAINEVNNLVKSHERDMINSELDDQTDAINKKYDEMEKSQNLTKMVTQALQTGFFEINGEIITLSTSMDSFIKDTTVGLTSINLASRELNENLANAISMLQQFNGYSGVNNLLPDVPYQLLLNSNGFVDSKTVFYDKGAGNSSPTINLGGITVNGNLDNVTLEDMNNTITKRLKDVIGNYIS